MNDKQLIFLRRSISIFSSIVIIISCFILFSHALEGGFSSDIFAVQGDIYDKKIYTYLYATVLVFCLTILASYFLLCYENGIKKENISRYYVGLSFIPFFTHVFCLSVGARGSDEIYQIFPDSFSKFFMTSLLPTVLFVFSIAYYKYSSLRRENRKKYSFLFIYRCISYPSYIILAIILSDIIDMSVRFSDCVLDTSSREWDIYAYLYSERRFNALLVSSTFFYCPSCHI